MNVIVEQDSALLVFVELYNGENFSSTKYFSYSKLLSDFKIQKPFFDVKACQSCI